MTTGQEGDSTTRNLPMIHGLNRAQRQHDQQTPRDGDVTTDELLWERVVAVLDAAAAMLDDLPGTRATDCYALVDKALRLARGK